MAQIRIDRLSLSVPGMSSERAHRLVQALATRLAEASLPPQATERLALLNLSFATTAGEDERTLASRIVAGLMAQMARTS
jgi:hypothetical protein